MHYRKIPILIAAVSFTGLTISSLSSMQQSAVAFVIASWIKPFSAIGFVSGLSIYYVSWIRAERLFDLLRTVLIAVFFFLVSFFVNAFVFTNFLSLFHSMHSYALAPSLIALLMMSLMTIMSKIKISPFGSLHETAAAALMPFYVILLVSLFSSLIYTGDMKIQWLSKDYLVKPAVYKEITLEETKKADNIVYSGPVEITYSLDFIRLYEKVRNEIAVQPEQNGDTKIADFAEFFDYYMFVIEADKAHTLLVYGKDGSPLKRIKNISRLYHSDDSLAAVNPVDKYVVMYDQSLNETFRITFPPSLTVEKVVFSNELFALLYSKKESGFEIPGTFSILYRLDTGSRVGRIAAADIAPRLKKTGFVTIDNTDKGLYITVLDHNSNKTSYLFKSGKFSNALIRQCGADRFFAKAQIINDGQVTDEYVLVYDFHRYRRVHESFKRGANIRQDMGTIIAVMGGFLLTDNNVIYDRSMREVFRMKRPHTVPYRIVLSPEKTSSFRAEGSIAQIDFSPFIDGYNTSPSSRVLLADIKGTLIIKTVTEFLDNYLAITNNRIFIYDRNLQLVQKIDFPQNGYIYQARIFDTSILLTFHTENSINIYSIDTDFTATLITSLNAKMGKIWDISEEAIVYGQEFSSSTEPKHYDDSAIIMAKGLDSDLLYQRFLTSSLYAPPSLVRNRLILPLKDFSEMVDLRSGRRTAIAGTITKAGSTSYGITSSGFVIELSTLNPFPYRFSTERIGTNIVAGKDWIDLHSYLVHPGTSGVYQIVRSGLTTLGENTVCSRTESRDKHIINCIDLDTMEIAATFFIKGDSEIVYSNQHVIFLKDNYSLVAIELEDRKSTDADQY